MSKTPNAFDIPKTSSWARELEENNRRSRAQSKHVDRERKKGREPMRLHLANSGTMKPEDRA
mgnify:CR=1 FL=1